MNLKVAVAADHAGFNLKGEVIAWLEAHGNEILDLGAYALDPSDDYPDFALAVAQAVSSGRAWRGVLVCGSGVGACITANKVPGVRACLCHDIYSAGQGVEHDDMNVLCLGARVIGPDLAKELLNVFVTARFSGEERHRRRLEKVIAIERQALKTGKNSP